MDAERTYTKEELEREVAAMERACRAAAERALKETERRARAVIAELRAEIKALRSRVAQLEGEGRGGGERLYTQAEVDELRVKIEKECFTEARQAIEETERRAREAIARWRRRAQQLGDQQAEAEETEEEQRQAAAATADEYDLSKYRYSEGVLQSVMKKYGIEDAQKLIEAAAQFDNGDRYLNRGELEQGAEALKSAS
ncbi:MAG: hypothetical protein KatS3mg102_1333 [Planctomycetota bacterium]|nr:MAG: hypothetical protein KatS3mg102_1333 [Planctomycetota bacterium]